MKASFISILSILVLLVSCNNNKPKETITYTSEDGKEKATIDVSKMKDVAADMEKIKENLTSLTPLTVEDMKALLPDQLSGARRTDLDVNAAMGTSMGRGTYNVSDSSSFDVTIMDCAGPAGSGIYTMQYLGMMNIQSDDEDEYTRTIDFKGGKAFENCKKARLNCVLTYFDGGRFLVALEGENVGIDYLKKAAGDLKLK